MPLAIKSDRNVTSGSRNRALGAMPQVPRLLPGYLNVTLKGCLRRRDAITLNVDERLIRAMCYAPSLMATASKPFDTRSRHEGENDIWVRHALAVQTYTRIRGMI